ncbi:FecR family protein [Aquimarina sp. D1M17]|uniref:FecR family protein n=1 Tax=Aquimarina acroporae TaxID=2937283 RepID=UPI0020BDE875|nr:FecR family protein [Aquimarina acroporae]MCK8521705.1 FecR family protein [Aquimarina acroporae]
MKKKDLIRKWLDNEPLNAQESKAFKDLDAYDSFMKIAETAKRFKAPDYNTEKNLEALQTNLSNPKSASKKSSYITIISRIAAVFILAIGLYTFLKPSQKEVSTLVTEKTSVILPDESEVILNALSAIKYSEKDWQDNRTIALDGEAYFKVAKGKKFEVQTTLGNVQVLGTQFNVKQRNQYFEVVCYEGLVSVSYNNNVTQLSKGQGIEIYENQVRKTNTSIAKPSWTENRSIFISKPFSFILREFERQYNVTIVTKNFDQNQLFTGNFVHSNIQTALQSITIPMRLKYEINDNLITLYRE